MGGFEFKKAPRRPVEKWPIVYHNGYNISFLKMEKLHPFDSGKWGNIHRFLCQDGMITENSTKEPTAATDEVLLNVHTSDYLDSLKWSINVAKITEVPPVALLPNYFVQRYVLNPLRLQTGGSIEAGKLAVRHGWSINIGGGFHHCSSDRGGGFCAFADITLLIKFAQQEFDHIKKVMIIDLDAHQGNGHERDFMNNGDVYILDVYNRNIYPHDGYAKQAISRKVELRNHTADREYLNLVQRHVTEALEEFRPNLIVYNAGTDILAGDPLGQLDVSAQGIIKRDELVFEAARGREIPIVMLTSGGYQRSTARIIADSLLSLKVRGLIDKILIDGPSSSSASFAPAAP